MTLNRESMWSIDIHTHTKLNFFLSFFFCLFFISWYNSYWMTTIMTPKVIVLHDSFFYLFIGSGDHFFCDCGGERTHNGKQWPHNGRWWAQFDDNGVISGHSNIAEHNVSEYVMLAWVAVKWPISNRIMHWAMEWHYKSKNWSIYGTICISSHSVMGLALLNTWTNWELPLAATKLVRRTCRLDSVVSLVYSAPLHNIGNDGGTELHSNTLD